MKKRSVRISGHLTSVSLEEEFWTELKSLAETEDVSMNALIDRIDKERGAANLSSALRLYVLKSLKA